MKKIMIAAAIVCAAAFAQAAATTWSISGSASGQIKNGTAVWTTLAAENTAKAYLILASDMDAVKADLDKGSTATAASKKIGMETTFTQVGRFDGTEVDLDSATKAYQMVFVYNDKTSGDLVYQFASASSNGSGGDPTAEPAVPAVPVAFKYSAFKSGSWTTVSAVPEPTSGLLLLLGVAGLALRRRRA